MDSIEDHVDLEDVRQPPLESAGMRRDSVQRRLLEQNKTLGVPVGGTIDKSYFIGTGGRAISQREIYYSFSQCIANEVPPHYRSYYVSYDNCKDLIRYLDAANDTFQRGIKCTSSTIPLKIRKMLNDSLQILLTTHASSMDEGAARALVPQVRMQGTILAYPTGNEHVSSG